MLPSIRLGAVVLDVKDAASAPRLKRASLQVRAGEIFGLAGLIGAGRTDLMRTVFALDELDAAWNRAKAAERPRADDGSTASDG